MFIVQGKTRKYNLCAYALVPQSLLIASQKTLMQNLIIIAAIMLILTSFLSYKLSRILSHPIEHLAETINRIKNGERELRVETSDWTKEISDLGNNFNEMLDRMQEMTREEIKAQSLLNQAEYNMLQAQINPHFLYNTLNTMSGIASLQNCQQISSLCNSLSGIFRYSLDMSDSFSTVAKEMMHVRTYLNIMDIRFHHSISYELLIDNNTLMDALPRISVQPIVENALIHGLGNSHRKDKKVTISAMHQADELVITVEDNGVGMDTDQVKHLLMENNLERVETGNSIGISNVYVRLKMLFGEQYGISIESEIDVGTRVFLRVPIIKAEEVSE